MKLISADFETALINTQYPEPLGYQGLAPIPICLSAMEAKGHPVLTVDIDQQADRFNRWMTNDRIVLVGQNLPFALQTRGRMPGGCDTQSYTVYL